MLRLQWVNSPWRKRSTHSSRRSLLGNVSQGGYIDCADATYPEFTVVWKCRHSFLKNLHRTSNSGFRNLARMGNGSFSEPRRSRVRKWGSLANNISERMYSMVYHASREFRRSGQGRIQNESSRESNHDHPDNITSSENNRTENNITLMPRN